jgi:hypothetical protein
VLSRRWPAALLVLLPLASANAALTRGEIARLEAGLGTSDIRILTTLDERPISRNAADDVQRSLVAVHQLDSTDTAQDSTIYCTSPQLLTSIDLRTPGAAIGACASDSLGPAYPILHATNPTFSFHTFADEQPQSAGIATSIGR